MHEAIAGRGELVGRRVLEEDVRERAARVGRNRHVVARTVARSDHRLAAMTGVRVPDQDDPAARAPYAPCALGEVAVAERCLALAVVRDIGVKLLNLVPAPE